MNRVNEEQWDESLMPDSREKCLSQADKLQDLLKGLPQSAQLVSEQPEPFWDGQRLSIHQRITTLSERKTRSTRLAWAAALALVLLATFLLRTGSRVALQPSAPDSDRDLLVQVEQALDGEVPQALQPASLIANEIDQAARPQSNSTSSKEKSEHEN